MRADPSEPSIAIFVASGGSLFRESLVSVLDDEAGMMRVRNVASNVVEITRMVKYATQAGATLPDEYTTTFRGVHLKDRDKRVLIDGVWRDKDAG